MKKFALMLALVLCLGTLVACGEKKATEPAPAGDGAAAAETLKGSAKGFHKETEIEVEVVREGETIKEVKVTKHEESADDIAEVKTALEQIPAAIVEKNGTDGVDVVAGATYTSEGIINAVKAALGK